MIIVLKNADFSSSNIGKITIDLDERTKTIMSKYGREFSTEESVAIQSFMNGLDDSGILSKLRSLYMPVFGSSLEDSFVNESTNTSAVITDKSMILGSKARRDIRAGEQIKVSDFCVIAKGDIVTIVASTNNLEIKTQGQALEEGKVNDLIQVKNVKTKKVIQAVVTGPNTVKVIF